jgi:Gluconate 2-dehydrogenase subunit 3
MNRRESLVRLSALAAHALFPQVLERFGRAAIALAQAPAEWQPEVLSPRQGRLLAEVVNTIIPDTDTPGAKAAHVHVFVDLMLKDCVPAAERQTVLAALDGLGDGFVTAARDERESRLALIDAPALALLKQLTLLGYFTSEIGASQALAYDPVPGTYRGCIDLKPGQRAWASR